MDFNNRNAVQQPAGTHAAAAPGAPVAHHSKGNKSDKSKWWRVFYVLLIVAVALVLVGVAVISATGGAKAEASYVDTSKLQAVFLNTGQVYFGNVKTLNSRYFVLTNIYYLQTNNANGSSSSSTASANTNVTLVKLGCELHEPYDKMVINSDQVTFWENLQDNGQVSKAVKTFEQQNPNGQKCTDQSSSSNSNSSNKVQSAGNSSTPSSSTPSTSTTPAKP
ncbi:MAG TPA: hypothetical protein VLF79_01680 [Candidatus Saccharimonadales bacterium]|nr:hypothetical protein [Candidatus Saccharimonadales bacterium]